MQCPTHAHTHRVRQWFTCNLLATISIYSFILQSRNANINHTIFKFAQHYVQILYSNIKICCFQRDLNRHTFGLLDRRSTYLLSKMRVEIPLEIMNSLFSAVSTQYEASFFIPQRIVQKIYKFLCR